MAAANALRLTTKGRQKRGTLSPVFASARHPQLSELGVTDAVLATIWRFGPHGITHEVGPLAERYYTGADIAFVDGGSRRILLYQAKMARLSSTTTFKLKSELKGRHRTLLTNTNPLSIAGHAYSLTGRLAVYQADHGDSWYDCARSYPAWRDVSLTGLGGWPVTGLVETTAAEGYYTSVMEAHASPCGVLAGRLTAGSADIPSVEVRRTWPWEYDAYTWCTRQPSPLDDGRRNADKTFPQVDAFERGDDGPSGWETGDFGDLAEFADALRRVLELGDTNRLYVVGF